MADSTALHGHLTALTSALDDLTTALAPLLSSPPPALSALAASLPARDTARLHVLSAYALETLLFNALRLSGADAKAHPVFRELARVRHYAAKIKEAEDKKAGRAAGPAVRVDREAARRVVRAGIGAAAAAAPPILNSRPEPELESKPVDAVAGAKRGGDDGPRVESGEEKKRKKKRKKDAQRDEGKCASECILADLMLSL
jgi:exosome complex protein LRP1